ncbi:YncE family protein, partial [Pseudomonas sp. PB105]|uniref:YncE family protein n=1 Tax=unclassified Pseudomonas TaxID=196821 RepID=UPI00131CE3A6
VTIPEAHAGQVDANANNTVQVLAYTFMTTGQPVWIIFEHDDGTPDYVLRNGDPLTPAESSAKKIVQIIPGTYLRSRPNGSQIRVNTLVSMDGFGDRNTAVQLGKPSYSIKKKAGIITHVEVGGAPARLVVSPDGSRVYVINSTSHSVSVISTVTHRVIYTITGFSNPHAIAISPNGGILYVSNVGTGQVTVINTTSYAFINQITGIATPYALALNTLGTRLYVTSNTFSALYTHDTSSGARLYTLGYSSPFSVTLNPSNSRIYVGAYTHVYTVDQPSNTAVGSLAGFDAPFGMAYSPHNVSAKPRLYVANTYVGNIKIMDTGTNVIRKTLTGFSTPYDIVMHPTQPFAYATDFGNNSLKIIDTHAEAVIDAVVGLNSPYGVAISPDGSTLYVSNYGGSSVTVIST